MLGHGFLHKRGSLSTPRPHLRLGAARTATLRTARRGIRLGAERVGERAKKRGHPRRSAGLSPIAGGRRRDRQDAAQCKGFRPSVPADVVRKIRSEGRRMGAYHRSAGIAGDPTWPSAGAPIAPPLCMGLFVKL
jgi:hypothetical protein